MYAVQHVYLLIKSFAIKISYSSDDLANREVSLMKTIDHPHIVKLYGDFCYSPNFYTETLCILIEMCEVIPIDKD